MHSKERLADYPSGFEHADTETLLEYYYVGGENIKRNLPIFDVLDTYGRFHSYIKMIKAIFWNLKRHGGVSQSNGVLIWDRGLPVWPYGLQGYGYVIQVLF